MKNHGRLAFSAVALAVILLLLRTPVTGAPIEVTLDADKFGKLDQKLTKCGDIGCGPTAAVNSFTYLQTTFPSVYKTPLVPAGKEVTVADTLADLMGCCGAGTTIENFIRGKKTYVESKDAGATKHGAEVSGKWNGADRPEFVHENATATDLLAFIERELRTAEDVEISIANAGVGHFLTLTGITFEDETRQRGQLSFIDPIGGMPGTTTFRIDANGDIRTNLHPRRTDCLCEARGLGVACSRTNDARPFGDGADSRGCRRHETEKSPRVQLSEERRAR